MSEGMWNEAIDRMLTRVRDTAGRVKEEGFPHWAHLETGEWVTTADGDWTGGYWIGMLWLAVRATGESQYQSWAEPLTDRLRARITPRPSSSRFPSTTAAPWARFSMACRPPRTLLCGPLDDWQRSMRPPFG